MKNLTNRKLNSAIALFLFLLLPLNAFAAGSISGKVIRQGRTNHSSPITFKLKNPGEAAVVQTYNVTTASDGSYAISDVPAGIYNLSAKASNSLSQNQVLIEVSEGQATPDINFDLKGGDANNDNSIATADMIIMRRAWLSTEGQKRYEPMADFNGDRSIGTGDLIIMQSNWLKNGNEPQVTIASPQDGSIAPASPITVSGTIDDNKAQVVVNEIVVTVANNTFTASGIPLTQGQNKISAIATNSFGNKSADIVSVLFDTIAPVIAITSPENGSISTTQPITVLGTIDDNQAAVTVNGSPASVSNGTFSCSGIALTQGQNTIAVTATDLVGNTSSASITVTYEPYIVLSIAITSPTDNALVNTPTISVSGTVTDTTATVTVNGIQATVTNNTFAASNIPLTQGTNIITAKAVKDSQTAENTVNVISDQEPPSINIYTPDNNSTTRSNIVYGRVSDDTQTVTVNGSAAELLSDFRFIGRPVLPEGANTITVQATDKAGNTNQASVSITYNTQTPKVTITLPLDNSTQNISPINVQGTNTLDIKFIIVNTATGIINSTNFTAEGVTLDSAKTVVTASGYDASNNKFSDSIVVNSPNLANYGLIKVSGDASEDDPDRPSAGSNQILKVKLEKNGLAAPNEEIQFRITQGNGALSQALAYTDINGEATTTLTTDANSDVTNQVECSPTNNPLLKITFLIDTKPGQPAILTKITDDSITPVPSATIPLIVKLTDSNNNPIQDETINFQVIQGIGTLSSPIAVTTSYGEAKLNLTCPNLASTLTQVQASSQTVPSVTVTFNITTSALLPVTVDDVIAKVNLNDSNIQDIKADITMTSNAPFSPPAMQLKIWQKGEKQKVEEISPTPQVKVRPPLQTSTENVTMQREIISYDIATNMYKIKTKQTGQIEEYPYQIDYVDYNKGVTLKTEYYSKEKDDTINLYTIEDSDFVQINGVWVFTKETKALYKNLSEIEYSTTSVYSNIQINTGIPDSEFR